MTTRTEHRTEHRTTTKQRIGDVRVEKREERMELIPSPETEPAQKPPLAFDALPTRIELPLTWD